MKWQKWERGPNARGYTDEELIALGKRACDTRSDLERRLLIMNLLLATQLGIKKPEGQR